MAIVHEPWLLISGVLTDTQSGSANIYGLYGEAGTGRKLNQINPGAPVEEKWAAEDANLLGHLLTDVINLGTVPLFLSSTALTATVSSLSAFASGSGTRWDALSSTFLTVSAAYSASSGTIAGFPTNAGWLGWPDVAIYNGPYPTEITASGFGVNMSGAIVYALYKASSSLLIATQMQNTQIALGNSATQYSQSLYGASYTGSIFMWASGAMQTLIDISSTFYGADYPADQAVSGAAVTLAYTMLGTNNLLDVASLTGVWTGSYPTSTFFALRADYYPLSAAFNSTSASYWVLSQSYSGNLVMTTALSAAFNSSASKWDGMSGSYYTLSGNLDLSSSKWNSASSSFSTSLSGVAYLTSSKWNPDAGVFVITGSMFLTGTNETGVKSFQITSSQGEIYAWTGNGQGQVYLFQGSGATLSGSAQIVAAVDFGAVDLTAHSGYYATLHTNAGSDYSRLILASGTQAAHFMVSQAGLRISSTFGPAQFNRDVTVTGTVSGSTGTFNVLSVNGLDVSGALVGMAYLTSANFTPQTGLFTVSGNLQVTGNIYATGSVWATGVDAGGGSVTNIAAGVNPNDAVQFNQFSILSQTLSGVLNVSSTTTPTAIYLKAPNSTVWAITITNLGVLSSTQVA